jgi:dTDP-4-amino-4,6-dideoxygalactose transaminase
LLDQTRRYANDGELTKLLETRFAALFRRADAGIVTASSGTAALNGAILAAAGRASEKKPICLMSGFIATALAAEQCGYRVHFVDIDTQTWALDAEVLAAHPLLDRTGLVVVTAPYVDGFHSPLGRVSPSALVSRSLLMRQPPLNA